MDSKILSAFFILTFLVLVNSHVLNQPSNFEDFTTTNISATNIACTVDIHTQTGSPQPVYIRPGTSQFFHPANINGEIQMSTNQAMEMWCSGAWASPAGAPNLITATCVSGQTFRYNNANFNFNIFRCAAWPQWTVRQTTSNCFNGGILVDVGYQVATRWLHVYTPCHDLVLDRTWHVKHKFTPISDGFQRSVERPLWSQAGFFRSSNVNGLYTFNQQRITLGNILGDPALGNAIVDSNPLSRGHLAAMNDFILATEQRSTFHFINTAPIWQSVVTGNWASIETSTSRLASDRELDLDAYTGTHGAAELPNASGGRSGIYLDWPAELIPVPKLLYRILINEADLSGVVLIVANNPFLTLSELQTLGYIVCPDMSSQINYVNWQRTNLVRGYSYACEVHEFLSAVPHIPELMHIRYRLLV